MMRLFERFPVVQRVLDRLPRIYRVRRMDRVKVATGFYQGYSGIVLHRRLLFWFAINVGGKPTYIGRWHLRILGRGKLILDVIRVKMIAKDRVPPFQKVKEK